MSSYNKLTNEEEHIILHKGTEQPFSGIFVDHKEKGNYLCKQCNTPLFSDSSKFDSGSGWPSFDDAIGDSVLEVPDSDGVRVEIICAKCQGHLGHIFRNEGFTDKNARYCVNSLSLSFEKK